MANLIIKKDGSKEPFDIEKLKKGILAASLQAGLSEEESKNIASDVSTVIMDFVDEKEEVLGAEIRMMTLEKLDEMAPSVSAAWRKYEESKVK